MTSPVCAVTPGAEPLTSWVVTNWDGHDPFALSVTGANTDSPSFSQASGVSLLAGLPDVALIDGDSIHASGSMTVTGASGFFPIQFRIGLFDEADSGPNTGDGAGYRGITIENDGFLKETVGVVANPFSSTGARPLGPGINIGGGMLSEANFTAQFSLDIHRNVNTFDISGFITTGNQYDEHFSVTGYPPELGFQFNRVGFLVGRMVSVDAVGLSSVSVTVTRAVPEPATALMSALPLICFWLSGYRQFARST
jgi:hypothetical protein